jgi:hypothetical protein
VSFVTFVVKNFATNAYFFGFALQRRGGAEAGNAATKA